MAERYPAGRYWGRLLFDRVQTGRTKDKTDGTKGLPYVEIQAEVTHMMGDGEKYNPIPQDNGYYPKRWLRFFLTEKALEETLGILSAKGFNNDWKNPLLNEATCNKGDHIVCTHRNGFGNWNLYAFQPNTPPNALEEDDLQRLAAEYSARFGKYSPTDTPPPPSAPAPAAAVAPAAQAESTPPAPAPLNEPNRGWSPEPDNQAPAPPVGAPPGDDEEGFDWEN